MKAPSIKVLIVDDETIVRKGLMATVNWNKYGMKVIADAPNGKRAWEEFIKHQPEIVITDIVMPEENGLDLARKIKENHPQTKILLLSCHKDFEYAQEGLKIGASGYLLKTTFEDEEMDHFLSTFKNEIQVKNPEKEEDNQDYPKVIITVKEYIVTHLSEPISVNGIADFVGVSRSHLSTMFKKKTGISIHAFIEEKRIELSEQLLKSTALTIQEIGERVGIQDAKYFSKWYKKCTGSPPSKYRSKQKYTLSKQIDKNH
ncbi:response regulator transcription factor [Peribacillus alkalitolerans]|uniref:response regulator transcription factor n=1 Tax=Peribacillus alkalitolerans TaxID=1550385 RepID=UPI0013D4F548|nr:response regulator [Peribacillus alkalitolerans]